MKNLTIPQMKKLKNVSRELVNGQIGELVTSKIIGLLVWRNLRIQDTTTGNPRIQRLEINNPRIQEKFVFRKNPTTQIGI